MFASLVAFLVFLKYSSGHNIRRNFNICLSNQMEIHTIKLSKSRKKFRDNKYWKFSKVRNFGDPILYTFAKESTRRTSTQEKRVVSRIRYRIFLGVFHPSPTEHANAIIYYLVIVYRRRYARTLQLFSIV